MDQIFDRLERLFKSWVTPDGDDVYAERKHTSGDSDFDSAMDELDDFLDKDRAAAEKRQAERERREREERARAEAEARNRARGAGGQAGGNGGPPVVLLEAYRTLGLAYGAPLKDVKASYKKLLLRYHPDRNSSSPEEQKRATEISARINSAYQTIETWTTTGSVPRE